MSQQEGVTETIADREYTMYMMPPIASHNLLMDVAKMVGPAIGESLGALLSGKSGGDAASVMEQQVTPELLSGALSTLFADINKTTMEKVIKAFREMTHVDGAPLDKMFDRHFQGKLDEMYKWLAFGMRVQWGKSLSALASGASGLGAFRPRPSSESESPTT